MSAAPPAPPILSTPDEHILEIPADAPQEAKSVLSEDALCSTYEIARTVSEIRERGWCTVALQFPDHMLVDAPRVAQRLDRDLGNDDDARAEAHAACGTTGAPEKTRTRRRRIFVLADTSYSACCVDEIAAEHADADGVVHYGRTCLSATSRVPVLYVYTRHELDHDAVFAAFEKEFPGRGTRVVVVADVTYQDHVEQIVRTLADDMGYRFVVGTEVVRDPSAYIPNRAMTGDAVDQDALASYALFHISDPPAALLLALHHRFCSLHVLSTPTSSSPTLSNPTFRTAGLLRRRFARVLTVASAGVIGILVNTLSVSNYLSSVGQLRDKIARAGKKSYTLVVGKLNPAKLANFAEIEAWVVVGCWESGLVDDDAGYWRPVVTPFELEVALTSEESRVWGGEWWGGIEKLPPEADGLDDSEGSETAQEVVDGGGEEDVDGGGVDGDESIPPEFDLRTGKLTSRSRPMRLAVRSKKEQQQADVTGEQADAATSTAPVSGAVVKIAAAAGELASINGVISPGAEFLRTQRTWQGLGGDFEGGETSTAVEEGRSGLARGYTVGDSEVTERR